MKGDKINEKALDQVAGGVIKDGDCSLSINGGNVIAVDGGQTEKMSVVDFKSSLIDAGFGEASVDKLLSMTQSKNDYDFAQVKEATGIDIGNLNI